jgi:hypothetical protein
LINPRARPCDEQTILSARGTVDCAARQRRWVLVATILASVIAYIDESVVNVALPAIAKDLATSVAAVQWVINAYRSVWPRSSWSVARRAINLAAAECSSGSSTT